MVDPDFCGRIFVVEALSLEWNPVLPHVAGHFQIMSPHVQAASEKQRARFSKNGSLGIGCSADMHVGEIVSVHLAEALHASRSAKVDDGAIKMQNWEVETSINRTSIV